MPQKMALAIRNLSDNPQYMGIALRLILRKYQVSPQQRLMIAYNIKIFVFINICAGNIIKCFVEYFTKNS